MKSSSILRPCPGSIGTISPEQVPADAMLNPIPSKLPVGLESAGHDAILDLDQNDCVGCSSACKQTIVSGAGTRAQNRAGPQEGHHTRTEPRHDAQDPAAFRGAIGATLRLYAWSSCACTLSAPGHLPCRQRVAEPDGQRAGFQADPFETVSPISEPGANRIRAGWHLGLSQKRPVLTHHANRRLLLRHVRRCKHAHRNFHAQGFGQAPKQQANPATKAVAEGAWRLR